MAHKHHTPNRLTESKWFRFSFSFAVAFGLALTLLLIPVTTGSILHIPVPQPAVSLLPADSTIDLTLPFGASIVRATNGLTITKSAPAFVDQGGIVTYTLTVVNETGSDLTETTIIDVVPTGATCLDISSPSGPSDPFWANNCGANAVWDLLYIPSIPFLSTPFSDGTTNIFTFSVTIDEPLPDQFAIVNNTYQISDTTSSFFDAGPAITTTVRAPNWVITKTVSSDTVQPGEFLTYTITISNDGSLATTGDYTVTDVLPTNTETSTIQIQSPGTLNGQTITWVITESLAVNASKTLTYAIQVTSPLTNGETIVNQTYSVTGANVYSEAAGSPITSTVVSSASLVITKTASTDPVQAGDLLTYTLTITNDVATSQGPAIGVIISDTLPGDVVYQSAGFVGGVTGVVTDTGQPTILWELTNPLAVGASAQVTVTVLVTSPLSPGFITNSFATSATNASLVSDTLTTAVSSTNTITMSKSVSPDVVAPGDTVTYTITLTNSGNGIATIALTDVLQSDFTPSTFTQSGISLPGRTPFTTEAITTVIFAATVPITPGTYSNQVVTATFDLTETVISDIAPVRVVSAAITITKVANVPVAIIGDTITYTYYITNTGDITLTGITLMDNLLGAITPLGTTTLGPTVGTTGTATTTVTVANLPGPIVNTATVTGTYLSTNMVTATATESVGITAITMEKIATPSSGSPAQIGDTITYTYLITNTGSATLTITLSDDQLGPLTVTPSTLGPDESATVTGTTIVTESHLPGPLVNVATVTGTNILAQIEVATATASVPLTYTTGISIEKSSNVSTATLDDVIVYSYRITNNGTISLTNIIIVDDKLGTITSGVSLPPGAITVITNYTVVSSDFTAFPVSNLVNTAMVSGTDFTAAVVTDTDTVTVTLVYTPQIAIAKTANVSVTKPGEIITYTFDITNTGNVTLTNITLTDDKLGPITVGSPLAPNGGNTTATVTYTVLVSDVPAITNTATVTGDDILSLPITDSTTHVVTVQEVLTAITATNSSPNIVFSSTFFTVTTNLSSGVTYDWNFGDGSSGTGQFPSHIYTTVGTYTAIVTASNGISLISGTTVVTITPGPVDRFILTATTPQTAGVAFPITITAVDAFGNTVTSFNQAITISDSTGTIVPTTVTLVNGITVTNFTVFSATSPALDTIQAISGTISGTVQIEILPNVPNTLTLTVNPTTIRVCQTTVATATVTDQFGNPIPGQGIDIGEFPVPPAHISPASASGTSNASGQFVVSLQGISNMASTGILANNAVTGPSAPQALTILDPAIPSAITVTVSPTSVFTTGTAIVTAEVTGCAGPVVGTVVTFTIPAAFGTVNPVTATTNASGIATTTVTAGNMVGTTLITATVEGPLSDDTPFTVLPPTAPVLSIVKTATPASGNTVFPGQTINYQIVVSNSGTATATNVVITDTLDPNVGFTGSGSIIPTGSGPVDTGGGVITFSVSSLGVGATVTATIQVTVTTSTSGTVINNSGTIDSNETSPLVSNPTVTHQIITQTVGPVFLPIIFRDCCLPNLVVDSLTIGAGNPPLITVVVRNAGNGPTDSGFWVDFYADPSTEPNNLTGSDRRWQLVSSQGIAWPISTIMAAGQSITLTSISGFDPNQTKWTTPLLSGSHSFYAFADSFDAEGASFMEILESDETDNQFGPVITALAAGLEADIPKPGPPEPTESPPRQDFAK